MTTSHALLNIRARFPIVSSWLQGQFVRSDDDHQPIACCIMAAIYFFGGPPEQQRKCSKILSQNAKVKSLADWNDLPTTSFQDVLGLLDAAILQALREENDAKVVPIRSGPH